MLDPTILLYPRSTITSDFVYPYTPYVVSRWLLFHMYRREIYLVYIGLYIPVISFFSSCSLVHFLRNFILGSALPHLWDRAVDLDALTRQGVTCTEYIPFDIESMSFNGSTRRKQA